MKRVLRWVNVAMGWVNWWIVAPLIMLALAWAFSVILIAATSRAHYTNEYCRQESIAIEYYITTIEKCITPVPSAK